MFTHLTYHEGTEPTFSAVDNNEVSQADLLTCQHSIPSPTKISCTSPYLGFQSTSQEYHAGMREFMEILCYLHIAEATSLFYMYEATIVIRFLIRDR